MTQFATSPAEPTQDENATVASSTNYRFPSPIPQITTSAPDGSPPGQPFQDVYKFVFQPLSHHVMSLTLETDHHPSIPRFHISVALNCFMPSATITSVYRDDLRGSHFVAEIGMGISAERAALVLPDEASPLDNIFSISRKVGWDWKRRKAYLDGNVSTVSLHWEETSVGKVIECHQTGDVDRRSTDVVAYMIIPPAPSRKQPMLEVTRVGMDVIDDIVVSSLLVQRRRLTAINIVPKEKSKLSFFS